MLKTNLDTSYNLRDIFNHCNIKFLSDHEVQDFEALQNEEILSFLESMANNKSPGLDGYPVEFLIYFWNDLREYMRKALNDCYLTGSLSVTTPRGVITLNPNQTKIEDI